MPQQSAPMLRRGLSMLGGLFGTDAATQPVQGVKKREAKLAAEYMKLGTFWCWRQIESDQPFESFSIPNQKQIKRKLAKSKTQIMLVAREKKLPGDTLVDIEQRRGCCLIQRNEEHHFIQLELKEETYNPNTGNFVFANNNNIGN
ncbi:uncharacterized protein BX663DRAFT_509325 [Cokeromyces recurvatus]|uniref:uncharacterized protein n=1 Tax=Cokeromyces recurvatus TaxID=90255 RepID=UPI00221E6C13|nr:uncharacterized protein BX663DRAFT_509325 [Cokeromyces recurvatus]KAI7903039.1 hypothetical protein BX663DRAFT_509325 [Cokeromyces recurvatus]